MNSLRNVAIIAHVDHGKTTLVDQMLKQSGTFRDNQQVAERAMDSNDLEKERGITILAKCTSVIWQDTRINIIDTPGHADFGGEVERILGMVDGVILLVDAAEGPMPQTKFVTTKALALGLKPIVVINKVDRPDGSPQTALNDVFDLFVALDATEEQLDFPVLYASGRSGWASKELEKKTDNLDDLFSTILEHVEEPKQCQKTDEPFSLLVRAIESDSFLGRILTGRIESGVLRAGSTIKALNRDSGLIEKRRVSKILAFRGLERTPIEEAYSGDIVAVAGMLQSSVADTLCDESVEQALHSQPVDPPTISMNFSINSSPFSGREGDKVQSRVIGDRLMQEVEGNVAIRVTQSDDKDSFIVAGRGELQLGVLIETMRREGYELSISRPQVLFHIDEDTKQKMEPIEEVTIDVDEEFSGAVIEKLSQRKGEVMDMRQMGNDKTRLVVLCPSRGLIGYLGEFLTDTRGTGVMNRIFHSYAPYKGDIPGRRNGALIAMADGMATLYSLAALEDRGKLFIGGGVDVYTGMIIGEHSRNNDLDVNPVKAKQLTNIRASGKDENLRLSTPVDMTLERAIAYIDDDELVEVTPKSIRLRKKVLNPSFRKSAKRA